MVKKDLFVDMTKVKLADGRLELCQLSKLLQLIRERQFAAIATHIADGVPCIVDYVHPEDYGETALGLAASVNDDEMIRHLLTHGAETDVYDLKGRSAAMRAAEMGHVQSMLVLAENGIDMKIVDESGQGVLFYCIGPTKRHGECGEIALNHGADVNNRTRQGTPILTFACDTARDNEHFIDSLLKFGADASFADEESNRTALMAAAESGSARVVRALLTAANNVDELLIPVKMHALHGAAKNGHAEVIKMLAAFGANFDQCTEKAYSTAETPIHLAAANGKEDCIVFLASRGTNGLQKNKENKTARAVAKELGVKPVIKACKKAEGMTKAKVKPPMWAIRLHDFCVIRDAELTAAFQKFDPENRRLITTEEFNKVLTEASAPMPETPADWSTVLANHAGAQKDTVLYNVFLGGRKLLPKKYLMSSFEPKYKKPKKPKKIKVKGWPMPIPTLPPQAVDPDTNVPRHFDVTDLRRFGCDRPPYHPVENDTAWYMAQPPDTTVQLNIAVHQIDRNTVRDAVYVPKLTAGGTVYQPVNPEPPPLPPTPEPPVEPDAPSPPPRVRPPPIWQVPVLKDKAQINLRNSTYKTPLMMACSMGNLELVKMMVEGGANVNQKDNFYWTALHHAAHAGVFSVVEYLLAHGAKIEAAAINGTTPLTRAVESCCPEIVQYLIDKGAKVRAENRCAMTPLDVAACFADYEVWNIIKTKEDSMPPVKGAKKKKKKPKKKAGKGPPPPKPPPPPRPVDLLPPLKNPPRPDAMMRLLHAPIRTENDTVEDVTFEPTHVWTKLLSSTDQMAERRERRRLYGWQTDFEDYETPFQRNIAKRLARVAAEEAAEAAYKLKTGKRK